MITVKEYCKFHFYILHFRNRAPGSTGAVNFVSVCWVLPNVLLTNSTYGELLSWKLQKIVSKR